MDELADSDLHTAVRYEDIEAVQAALDDADCHINQIGLYRWSPLHEAASCGYADIVRLLLTHGADPNLRDALSDSTAVHYAAKGGHIECLQLLLDAGGRYDLEDANGATALDIASSTSKKVLESRRILDLTKMTLDDARKSVAISCSPRLDRSNTSTPSSKRSSNESSARSIASSGSPDASLPAPRAAWLLQASAPNGPSIGLLHASFEYHSKKRYLKIRASKLSNVNLTQESSSSIGAIYVKCRLEPDDQLTKNTKRKTEEVKVEPLAKKETPDAQRPSAVKCYPSSFSFTKPLEYSDVGDHLVLDRTLRLQVCVSHRVTRKSYVVGDVVMPLRVATTKLLKEAYPVRPCPYADAPNGMRVLTSAGEAGAGSYRPQSDPDLRLRSPLGRLLQLDRQWSYRASSDTQLREVVAIRSLTSSESSVSIDMPEASDEFGLAGVTVSGDRLTMDRPSTASGGTAAIMKKKDINRNVVLRTPLVDEAADNDPLRLREVKIDNSTRLKKHSTTPSPSKHVAISVSPLARAADDMSGACAIQIPGDCVEIPMEN